MHTGSLSASDVVSHTLPASHAVQRRSHGPALPPPSGSQGISNTWVGGYIERHAYSVARRGASLSERHIMQVAQEQARHNFNQYYNPDIFVNRKVFPVLEEIGWAYRMLYITKQDSARFLRERNAEPYESIEFGVVQTYDRKKGYGFVDCIFPPTPDHKDRLFVYHENVQVAQGGFRYLVDGARISFVRRTDSKSIECKPS